MKKLFVIFAFVILFAGCKGDPVSTNQKTEYKEYVATITQGGARYPVATVINNSLSANIFWNRVDVGIYDGELTGAFLENKTVCSINNNMIFASTFTMRRVDVNHIEIITFNDSGVKVDGYLYETEIMVRVYN